MQCRMASQTRPSLDDFMPSDRPYTRAIDEPPGFAHVRQPACPRRRAIAIEQALLVVLERAFVAEQDAKVLLWISCYVRSGIKITGQLIATGIPFD